MKGEFGRWRSVITVECLFMLVLLAATNVLAADYSEWRSFENRNFRAISNAKDDRVLELLHDLETFRLIASQFSPVRIPQGTPKPLAVIFRNQREFDRYSESLFLASYSTYSAKQGMLVLSLSHPRVHARYWLRHEYVHILQAHHKYRFPKWYREGMAELLSAIRIDGQGYTIGEAPADGPTLVRDVVPYDRIILDEFDLIKPTMVTVGTSPYWQCWLLTHFFLLGADAAIKEQFKDYLKLYNRGMSSEEAFSAAFDLSPKSLWSKYLRRYARKTPKYGGNYDIAGADFDFSVEVAEEREVSAVLASLREDSAE